MAASGSTYLYLYSKGSSSPHRTRPAYEMVAPEVNGRVEPPSSRGGATRPRPLALPHRCTRNTLRVIKREGQNASRAD